MTREEYIKICSMCTNRSFNPKMGIVCGLTNEPANFDLNCPDYNEDDNAVKHDELRENNKVQVNKKSVNNGRAALFVIGLFYLVVGFYEAYVILGANIIFGIIDWIVAAVFIGLGILSYKKASLSLIIGLAFYVAILVLLFIIEPWTLLNIWIVCKAIVISWLVYGISSARKEEKKKKEEQKLQSEELLDQL